MHRLSRLLPRATLVIALTLSAAGAASAQPMWEGDTLMFWETRYSDLGQYRVRWKCYDAITCVLVHEIYHQGQWVGRGWLIEDWFTVFDAPYVQIDYGVIMIKRNSDGAILAWTGPYGTPGVTLNRVLGFQDDGNIVMYETDNWTPLWTPLCEGNPVWYYPFDYQQCP